VAEVLGVHNNPGQLPKAPAGELSVFLRYGACCHKCLLLLRCVHSMLHLDQQLLAGTSVLVLVTLCTGAPGKDYCLPLTLQMMLQHMEVLQAAVRCFVLCRQGLL
jgi:hypothetical protein